MSARTEHDILVEIIDPGNPSLTPDAARGILQLDYPSPMKSRIAELAAKSNQGELTVEERREYENHINAGDLISVLKGKALLSLQNAGLRA